MVKATQKAIISDCIQILEEFFFEMASSKVKMPVIIRINPMKITNIYQFFFFISKMFMFLSLVTRKAKILNFYLFRGSQIGSISL